MLDVYVKVKHERAGAHSGRSEDATWTIAEMAEEFGVTHRTVRHYEDQGLISPERAGTRRSTTGATAPGWR